MTHPDSLLPGQRPEPAYRTGAVTRLIRFATIALMAVVVVLTLIRYPALPKTIPTHFGPSGAADAWGPRATVLLLLALGAAVVGGLTYLSYHPRTVNAPVRITTENAQRIYRSAEQMTVWITASVALLYTGIALGTVLAFNPIMLVVPGSAGLILSLVAGLILIARSGRPEQVPDETETPTKDSRR